MVIVEVVTFGIGMFTAGYLTAVKSSVGSLADRLRQRHITETVRKNITLR